MYCGKCGKEIEGTERFCRHCGAKNNNFKEELNAEDIVRGIKERNEKAIETFYSMTYKQGFSVAIQIVKNEQDAMDLLQDAYLSALLKIEQLNDSAKIKSWFNCIVANRCRDWLKKKKKHNTQLFVELENDEYDEGVEDRFANENMQFSPDESVDYAETKRLMQKILDKLPEDQRLCVLMYYYEELSVGEIAQALDCSAGTVKSRLNYARKKIKDEVEELERKGTKLYGIAPLPFIAWMLSSGEKTLEVKASGLGKWRQYVTNSGADHIAKGAKAGADHVAKGAKTGAAHVAKGAKAGAAHVVKRAVAGVVAAAVVGTGAYVGYTKYVPKSTDTKQEQIKKDDSAKKEKESIPEFTLSEEQQEKIQYAAGMFMRAAREEEDLTQDDDFKLQIKKGKVSDSIISTVATAIAYEDDSVMSEGEDPSEIDKEDPFSRKFLRIEDCQKFLKDSFEYDAKTRFDVNKIFAASWNEEADCFEAWNPGESDDKHNSEELCKVTRYAQTGKDEFHFYAKILDPEDNGGNATAGTMEITAHKNDKSKIGGFVFDKITYKSHTNDLVLSSIENTVTLLPRAIYESGMCVGTYEIDKMKEKDFILYANMFIHQCLNVDMLTSEEGVYEGNIIKLKDYEKICRETLGRTKKYKVDGVAENKVTGGKVEFDGARFDATYVIKEIASIENFDGKIKAAGKMMDYTDGKEYVFKAEGYKDNKSKTGVVVNKLVISNK